MTRAVVFLAAAMVAASLGLVAQDTSGARSNSNQERIDNSALQNLKITGCLSSSASGGYSLSDDRGNSYLLSGATDNLRTHKSQQVEVAGQQQFAASDSSATSPTSTIQVTSTRVVGDHCASVSQSKHDPDNSDIASVDDAVNNEQLPQTSTILPLLGLIGLGSLVAGFFARQ